jgi:hypothetical protein
MKLLLNDLRLRERREWLREIFEHAIPVTEQDVVIVFASATGHPPGVRARASVDRSRRHRSPRASAAWRTLPGLATSTRSS